MSEMGSGAQAALNLSETLNVLGREVHSFCAFARDCQIIERQIQLFLLVDKISINVYKTVE